MLIQTQAELSALAKRLEPEKVLAVDTEFASEGRYYAEPAIMQMATRTEAMLVDLLAVRDISPLHALLLDPAVTKVFHAGKQDLDIFYRLIGRPVVNVFDTQMA
ncbi:MAG TPA: hypothetical protein VE783_12970, partial [Candidatus Limnocylindrales bacterium]|nr:hypothetical protein [Candidatus Limnocylindrales bacterium]